MECLPACQAYSLLLSRQLPIGREEISGLSHATRPRSQHVFMAFLLFPCKLNEVCSPLHHRLMGSDPGEEPAESFSRDLVMKRKRTARQFSAFWLPSSSKYFPRRALQVFQCALSIHTCQTSRRQFAPEASRHSEPSCERSPGRL